MKSISEINIQEPEGRLLMAAIAMITTESRTSQAPDKVLAEIFALSEKMYPENVVKILTGENKKQPTRFQKSCLVSYEKVFLKSIRALELMAGIKLKGILISEERRFKCFSCKPSRMLEYDYDIVSEKTNGAVKFMS